jgi:hypothetical protein
MFLKLAAGSGANPVISFGGGLQESFAPIIAAAILFGTWYWCVHRNEQKKLPWMLFIEVFFMATAVTLSVLTDFAASTLFFNGLAVIVGLILASIVGRLAWYAYEPDFDGRIRHEFTRDVCGYGLIILIAISAGLATYLLLPTNYAWVLRLRTAVAYAVALLVFWPLGTWWAIHEDKRRSKERLERARAMEAKAETAYVSARAQLANLENIEELSPEQEALVKELSSVLDDTPTIDDEPDYGQGTSTP